MKKSEEPMQRPKLVTPEQLVELYPAIKLRTLRYWIQHATPRETSQGGSKVIVPGNGLADAIIRIDRITLVDEDRFLAWLNSRRMSAA